MARLAHIFFGKKYKVVMVLLSLTALLGCDQSRGGDEMDEVDYSIVSLSGETFKIPKEYLSPYGNPDEKIIAKNIIEIDFYLPNFSGSRDKNFDINSGSYNFNDVSVYWTVAGGGGRLNAKERLKNSLRYNLLVRDSKLDLEGYEAYKNNYKPGVSYMVRTTQGDDVLIICGEGPVNSICVLEYSIGLTNRGVFASFDRKNLMSWLDIVDKVQYFINEWKVEY